jgi:hypothetical protein
VSRRRGAPAAPGLVPTVPDPASGASGELSGFGYDPAREAHHYRVRVSRGRERVSVYECPAALDPGAHPPEEQLRVALERERWDCIAPALADEFNRRLRAFGLPAGRWSSQGFVPLARLLGKELLVLAWAVEHEEVGKAPIAVANWLGMVPEERWWLHAMTAAHGARATEHRGWRRALRYALCDTPGAVARTPTRATALPNGGLGALFERPGPVHEEPT